jgi:hypothetical protein
MKAPDSLAVFLVATNALLLLGHHLCKLIPVSSTMKSSNK